MQSIAIIGAGPSGLTAAKAALESGLEPTVLEKGREVGGLWQDSVWNSMHTNLSYHSCAFSDMPWQNPSSPFPHQREVLEYLKQYATHFSIMPRIEFESEVKCVEPQGKRWKVTWLHNDMLTMRVFDFLIVASGFFSRPHIPQIGTFSGDFLHSKEYKEPSRFTDKVVAVIGNSFSGTEIASEIAQVARKTYHISNKALWVLPTHLPATDSTKPLDLVFYSRAAAARSKGVEAAIKNERVFNWFRGLTKQHEICSELAVEHPPRDPSFVAISDTYLNQVRENKIELVRGRVRQIVDQTLNLDGRTLTVDSVVFATGYECHLPFMSEQLLQTIEYDPRDQLQPVLLHKCVFHPQLANIAFVGMYRGPYFATMELQARLATYAFAQIVPMPSELAMQEGLQQERKIRAQVPRPQFPHGNYVDFADELAALAGVLPDLERLQREDPELYKKLWDGPLLPAHYRLQGFSSNPTVAKSLIDAAAK